MAYFHFGRAFWINLIYIYCALIYNMDCILYDGMPPLEWGACSAVAGIYRSLAGIETYGHCIHECKGWKQCTGVNYWRMTRICELLDVNGDGAVNDEICIYISRGEMAETEEEIARCSSCNEPNFCDVDNGQCTTKDCQPLVVDNADVYGNVSSFGMKAAILCHDGFVINGLHRSESSTCLQTGKWNGTQLCVSAI